MWLFGAARSRPWPNFSFTRRLEVFLVIVFAFEVFLSSVPPFVAPFPLLVRTGLLQEGVTDDPVFLAAEGAWFAPFCDIAAVHTLAAARDVEITGAPR